MKKQKEQMENKDAKPAQNKGNSMAAAKKEVDQLLENTERLTKICDIIEFFAYNKLNLLLVERAKGITLLMNCLTTYTKIFQDKMK